MAGLFEKAEAGPLFPKPFLKPTEFWERLKLLELFYRITGCLLWLKNVDLNF
jgi:hypothetical protein